MNLEEFLELRGADLPSLMKVVKARVGLRNDDVVLAVGSLVEGLGNHKSDVDLLLISPRKDRSLFATRDIGIVVGRCLVDLRPFPAADMEQLFERVKAWAALPWNVTATVGFSIEERMVLHRVLTGMPLHRGPKNRILKKAPSRAELARLKLRVARHESRTIQVDMVGLRDDGDARSLVFAAQEMVGYASEGLTASYGMTNPQRKWRSRLLEEVPRDWQRSLIVRPTGLHAADVVWRLLRAPEHASRREALAYALRATTFARAVFLAAELQLVNPPGVEIPRLRWPRVPHRSNEPPLPFLDLDVDFFLGGGEPMLGRLNEFGEPLPVSAEELAVALLFDGQTTASEAAAAVFGGRKDGRDVVRNLLAEIDRRGFSARARDSRTRSRKRQ